jgi:hypothetical protein
MASDIMREQKKSYNSNRELSNIQNYREVLGQKHGIESKIGYINRELTYGNYLYLRI